MGNFQSSDQNIRFPLKVRRIKRYGAIPDIPDQRDIYTVFPKLVEYYQSADLRKTGFLPEVYNQGDLGSSVAHAVLSAYVFSLKKNGISVGGERTHLSTQFIYYNQRIISGTVECDSGSSLRDGIKVLERLGTCTEEMYPYSTAFFRDRPTDEAYTYAFKNKHTIQYRRVKILLEEIMKSISIKVPVLMSFTVYESFQHIDVARTGIMPVPKLGEKIVGSHAVLIVGYDIPKKYILCRNSWGSTWGQGGYFWIPFSFVNERNCSDLWIISVVESVKLGISGGRESESDKTIKNNEVKSKLIEKVPEFKEDQSDEENELETDTIIS